MQTIENIHWKLQCSTRRSINEKVVREGIVLSHSLPFDSSFVTLFIRWQSDMASRPTLEAHTRTHGVSVSSMPVDRLAALSFTTH